MEITGVAPLLTVSDLDRSVRFYRLLGFEPLAQWDTYAKLAAGERAVLHLATEGDPPPDRPTVALQAPSASATTVATIVVVEVADCRQACDQLTAADVALLTRPATPPWGGVVHAFVRDPDGHLVELKEPAGRASAH